MKNKIAEKLFTLAYTDSMTGVKNRNAYEEELDKLRKSNARLDNITVVVIDINNIKEINGTHGHRTGDLIIKKVADCLEKTIGNRADVYRVGFDDFVCIAERDILSYVSEFRDLIGFENRSTDIPFYVSLGYMKYDGKKHKTIDELITGCDKKMNNNKKRGR